VFGQISFAQAKAYVASQGTYTIGRFGYESEIDEPIKHRLREPAPKKPDADNNATLTKEQQREIDKRVWFHRRRVAKEMVAHNIKCDATRDYLARRDRWIARLQSIMFSLPADCVTMEAVVEAFGRKRKHVLYAAMDLYSIKPCEAGIREYLYKVA